MFPACETSHLRVAFAFGEVHTVHTLLSGTFGNLTRVTPLPPYLDSLTLRHGGGSPVSSIDIACSHGAVVFHQLPGGQLKKHALEAQQFLKAPALHNAPAIQHNDPVAFPNGG